MSMTPPASAGLPAPAATHAAARPVLDAEALARLRELDPTGSTRLVGRVVEAYRTSAGRLEPQMREALARGDHAGVRHAAHTLKSASANVGALQLSALCAAVETMVRSGEVAGLDPAVEALGLELARALAALGQLPEVRA
jgi:HPt (histidine-containing phosphotransfer) domain-containing protein